MYINKIDLLLGTNLKNKNENLQTAKELILKEIGNIIRETEIIETLPIGFNSKNLFLNQAIKIESALSPIQVLEKCKSIEAKMGRTPINSEVYEDRLIDIDILYFNNLIFKSKKLIIPHVKNTVEREFAKRLILNLNKD